MMNNIYHMFASYYAKGGLLMWPIFAVSIVAWYMGIEKYLYLNKFKKSRRHFLKSIAALQAGKPLKDINAIESFNNLLKQLGECRINGATICSFSLLFREFLICSVAELERGFGTMKIWISVAPLLGLLGTVNGMIRTFQIITDFGFGNPSLMAEGISVALVTPQAGLTAAFPLMLFHNYLAGRSQNMTASMLKDGEMLIKHLGSAKEQRLLQQNN